MKLFWKQFVGILSILIVMFTIFGSVLTHTSFQTALDNELDSALEDAVVFQYTVYSSIEGVSDTYQLDQKVVVDIVKTIDENIGNTEDTLLLYDADLNVLYREGQHIGNIVTKKVLENTMMWQLTEQENVHYLETWVCVTLGEDTYYIEKNRNVQSVYDNRDALLQQYRMTVGVLLVVAAVFAAVLAYSFTKPIRKLSRATRAFAKGDYQRRVKPLGNDELTVLMEDFNAMAQKLEGNIWELNDAVRRQEEFTGAFAHELKTPLTSIIGYSELLMTTELSEEARMMSAGYIYQDGKRLERLAYKMMELVRVDKQEISLSDVDVQSLMETLQEITLPMMAEKSITLKIQVEEGCVRGDRDLLLSLFLNLVDNARKACEKGGNIRILGRKSAKGYQLEIKDDGRGVPPEQLPHITEAFYMVDKSRARKEGGAGLGMALCAKILALHQGKWRMKSEPGKGTVISIWFPGKEQA